MPRPGHSRKNPDAESFQNSVAEKLECLGVESGGRVKVWFMDEARLGLHAEMRRVWALRGKRPVVTRHQIPVGIPMRRAERSKRGGRCGCRADDKRAASDPSYRRALWIVVVLNLSFGLVEIIGGFFARSQALKADALDFLGDGSITLVGLFALAWAERIRARVALTLGPTCSSRRSSPSSFCTPLGRSSGTRWRSYANGIQHRMEGRARCRGRYRMKSTIIAPSGVSHAITAGARTPRSASHRASSG